jgi:hypothetical protein
MQKVAGSGEQSAWFEMARRFRHFSQEVPETLHIRSYRCIFALRGH